MTSKNILDEEKVDLESQNGSATDADLDALLSSEAEEDEFKTEFVDKRLQVVTRARSLIMYWQQLHQQISQIKEGYKLAKLWEDDELKNQYMEQGRPLVEKEKILNKVIKDVLSELKDVPFLSQNELIQLPKWMLKTLNVNIGTESSEDSVETEPVTTESKSKF